MTQRSNLCFKWVKFSCSLFLYYNLKFFFYFCDCCLLLFLGLDSVVYNIRRWLCWLSTHRIGTVNSCSSFFFFWCLLFCAPSHLFSWKLSKLWMKNLTRYLFIFTIWTVDQKKIYRRAKSLSLPRKRKQFQCWPALFMIYRKTFSFDFLAIMLF